MTDNASPGRTATLRDRLKRHFLTCSATAAAALAWSDQAHADIIYFSSANDPDLPRQIAANFYGVYVNVLTGSAKNGSPGNTQPGGPPFINIYANSGTTIDNVLTNPATFYMVTTTPGGTVVANLPPGTTIGPGSNFAVGNFATGVYNAASNATALFGFEFNPTTNQTDFGWIRVSGGANADDRTVIDFAYENTGAPILAGATPLQTSVPEPSMLSLGLLALGAGGIVALRQRRRAARAAASTATGNNPSAR
jgi:hypothetical protein